METEGLLQFKSNPSLSDITLSKASAPDADSIKGHKVVLAASSGLLYDLFMKEDQELVETFKIPAFIETKSAVTEDPYNKAFSYMYCDQQFEKIKDELSPNNVFQLYSVAYTLRIRKLINDLEEFIVNELLDNDNSINFYLDGIRFKSKRITDACEKILVQEFQEVINSKDGHYFLSQLPLTYFQNLMGDSELNVDNETRVLECVEKYIRHRVDTQPDKTAEEKKAERAAIEAAGEEAPPDPEEEEKTRKEEEFNALDDQGKIQWKYNEEVDKMRREASERMRVRGMRPEEKRELFKTIRFAFLTHQELLKCSRDPIFDEAKDYFIEGLTYKIEPEEVLDKDNTLISLNERAHYVRGNDDPRDLNVNAPQRHRLDPAGDVHQENTLDDHVNHRSKTLRNERDKFSPRRGAATKPGVRPGLSNQRAGYPASRAEQLSYPKRSLHGGMEDTFARADTDPYHDASAPTLPPVRFAVPGQGRSRKHGPQTNWADQQVAKTSFDYNYDMDEEGAFNYLATEGGRKIWQNPHVLGQVQAFASSIGFGTVQDLVGRKCVNLRTLNEPFSFFGVDLGEGRKLLPTCYTIMNRNSSTHVLMNWHFEGSNDKLNWTILDRRVYMPSQLESASIHENQHVDQEIIDSLCQKQQTNTWGIDQNVYNDIDTEGFRFFRIIQISPNSSGSDNLALSCFEVYGKIVSGRFP